MILSILICTLPDRALMLKKLLDGLNNNIDENRLNNYVEILTDSEVGVNVGHKRNLLLKRAQGDYIVFIDDDDKVHPQYVKLIYDCIKNYNYKNGMYEKKLDCIAINGTITTDGQDERRWYISKEFGKWYEDKKVYYRTPNHISPVKREIALSSGFPSIVHGEDYHYSMRILPHLVSEAEIKQPIYHYDFRTK